MSDTPALSFTKASFDGDPPPPDSCAFCHQEIAGPYYRVNNHLACASCAQRAESLVPPDSHTAFSRAVFFGVIAAVVGCAVYATVEITTGFRFSLVAIAVGYIVGWAMKKGSRGLGGRRYQIAGALLTYAAVACAFVPVAIHELREHPRKPAQVQTQSQDGAAGDSGAAQQSAQPPAERPQHGFLFSTVVLLGLGLVSPFLQLTVSVGSGLLNLLIIFWGVQFAWRAMASPRPQIEGPYSQAS